MYELPYFNLAFSQILRTVREQRKMTQMALAAAIGGSEVAIRRLERGVQTPTTTTLILLARALSISPTNFLSSIIDRMDALEFAEGDTLPDDSEGVSPPSQ